MTSNPTLEGIGPSADSGPELRYVSNLRAVEAGEFLRLQLPPRKMILNPILSTQGLSMIHSIRGTGKTYLALGIAHAVSTGTPFLRWSVENPCGVLYVDGEMPAVTLQARYAGIAKGADASTIDQKYSLKFITPDLQSGPMPDLSTIWGQSQVDAHLDGIGLVILDNLSCLCRSGKENEAESWLPVQGWALRLRQSGIAVLFLHHSGKGGAQRGTSRREDLLDTVLSLRHPADYSPSEGLRCEIHVEKARSFHGDAAKGFEATMQAGPDGSISWMTREIEDAFLSQAQALHESGASVREIAEELKISRSKAHRLIKKLKGEV
jgi:putative DNA primase/helicase